MRLQFSWFFDNRIVCSPRRVSRRGFFNGLPQRRRMKVLVILFRDIRIEGVEAVVEIPEGQTAEEVFDRWVAADAAENEIDAEDIESHRESFELEEMEVTTLK